MVHRCVLYRFAKGQIGPRSKGLTDFFVVANIDPYTFLILGVRKTIKRLAWVLSSIIKVDTNYHSDIFKIRI